MENPNLSFIPSTVQLKSDLDPGNLGRTLRISRRHEQGSQLFLLTRESLHLQKHSDWRRRNWAGSALPGNRHCFPGTTNRKRNLQAQGTKNWRLNDLDGMRNWQFKIFVEMQSTKINKNQWQLDQNDITCFDLHLKSSVSSLEPAGFSHLLTF